MADCPRSDAKFRQLIVGAVKVQIQIYRQCQSARIEMGKSYKWRH